jgi:hypothetical protein
MSVNRILEVVQKGRTHLVKFDLEATYNTDEFREFVVMKESNLKVSGATLKRKFGPDLYLHLDLAYNLLKEVDISNK